MPEQLELKYTEPRNEIMLAVSDRECRGAKRGDPAHCALAEAARRQFRGLRKVAVLRHVSYFVYADRVEKYRNAAKTADLVRVFDKTGAIVPGLYRFLPLSHSWSRKGLAEKNRRYSHRPNGSQPSRGRRHKVSHVRTRGHDEHVYYEKP